MGISGRQNRGPALLPISGPSTPPAGCLDPNPRAIRVSLPASALIQAISKSRWLQCWSFQTPAASRFSFQRLRGTLPSLTQTTAATCLLGSCPALPCSPPAASGPLKPEPSHILPLLKPRRGSQLPQSSQSDPQGLLHQPPPPQPSYPHPFPLSLLTLLQPRGPYSSTTAATLLPQGPCKGCSLCPDALPADTCMAPALLPSGLQADATS